MLSGWMLGAVASSCVVQGSVAAAAVGQGDRRGDQARPRSSSASSSPGRSDRVGGQRDRDTACRRRDAGPAALEPEIDAGAEALVQRGRALDDVERRGGGDRRDVGVVGRIAHGHVGGAGQQPLHVALAASAPAGMVTVAVWIPTAVGLSLTTSMTTPPAGAGAPMLIGSEAVWPNGTLSVVGTLIERTWTSIERVPSVYPVALPRSVVVPIGDAGHREVGGRLHPAGSSPGCPERWRCPGRRWSSSPPRRRQAPVPGSWPGP